MATEVTPKERGTNQKEDHTTGIVFSPPLYLQRYNLCTKYIEKVTPRKLIDFGCAEGKFIRVLRGKNYDFLQKIFGVDIDTEMLELSQHVVKSKKGNYNKNRTTPLKIALYRGSLTDWDPRIEGVDFVSLIEVIEHLEEDTLTQLPAAIFGRLRAKHVLITTPNSEFNILFKNLSGFRHPDHKFEWTRDEFMTWCEAVCHNYPYLVEFCGVGEPPMGLEDVGYCSQGAFFSIKPEIKLEASFSMIDMGTAKSKIGSASPKLEPGKSKIGSASPKLEQAGASNIAILSSELEEKLRVDPKYSARISELRSKPKLLKSRELRYDEIVSKEFP